MHAQAPAKSFVVLSVIVSVPVTFCVRPERATQQSVDCESLTPTQGASQKSVH